MPIRAQLLVKDPGFDERRAAHREPVDVRAGFRKTGYEAAKADVSDISLTGCKVDSAMSLGIGAEVWIRFPGLQPMQATIAWSRGFEAGCKFTEPFHPAVLDDFLRRHRAA
ncbi:PilZ domain-containing protein [Parasphingopyxis sp.]|uniref:PilZ domain-containing protein n=1 Tax=Parasphingopyxis sp. TaxID=1920299 RepID=UPI0026172DC0|nr:PilZ domain-containing protein [Parasphingopyxis sp.]